MKKPLFLRTVEIPRDVKDTDLWKEIVRTKGRYAMFGLVVTLISIIGGIVLFMNGIFGSISWTAKLVGFESELADAPAGVVLFVVGLYICWVTRFEVKVKEA